MGRGAEGRGYLFFVVFCFFFFFGGGGGCFFLGGWGVVGVGVVCLFVVSFMELWLFFGGGGRGYEGLGGFRSLGEWGVALNRGHIPW